MFYMLVLFKTDKILKSLKNVVIMNVWLLSSFIKAIAFKAEWIEIN